MQDKERQYVADEEAAKKESARLSREKKAAREKEKLEAAVAEERDAEERRRLSNSSDPSLRLAFARAARSERADRDAGALPE